MKKSIILSLLLMVAGLSVPARMNAMLWPAVKIGLAITAGAGAISVSGVGLGICLWNKYLWINKPKRRMEQNKIHLMTDNLQKLSDTFLDAMTDQRNYKDRLHTWYLKKYGYNKLYKNDPQSVFKKEESLGYIGESGGIHIRPEVFSGEKITPQVLVVICHELAHIFNGDRKTRLFQKSTILTSEKEKFLKKASLKRKLSPNWCKKELLANKKTIMTLYNLSRYDAVKYLCSEAKKDLEKQSSSYKNYCNIPEREITEEFPYTQGTVEGLQELLHKYPQDKFLKQMTKLVKLTL